MALGRRTRGRLGAVLLAGAVGWAANAPAAAATSPAGHDAVRHADTRHADTRHAARHVEAPAAPAVRGDCSDWRGAVAGIGRWLVSESDCGYASSISPATSPARKGYTWATQAGTSTRICVEGQGNIWSPKRQRTVKRWYSLGCGTSGGGLVPWRSRPFWQDGKKYFTAVLATPRVRAMVQPGFLGGLYRWAH